MTFKSTTKAVQTRQNSKPELMAFKLDVSAHSDGTNQGLVEGANYATVTKSGTGAWVFTLNRKALRNIHIVGIVCDNENFGRTSTSLNTPEKFFVTTPDDGGVEADVDFSVTILAFYSEYER